MTDETHVANVGEWSAERRARACLTGVVEAGSAGLEALLRDAGPEELWHTLVAGAASSTWANRAKAWSLEASCALVDDQPICFLIPGDPQWPAALTDLEAVRHGGLGGVPLGLWVRGVVPQAAGSSVAIVGSRASTGYGERVATDLAAELAQAGHPVVSGGAYGIDAAAHRGALAVEGATVAVMAGGLDQLYPKGNEQLLQRVGSVVSEVAPGLRPTKAGFLARNRLLAALTVGTVLVEASHRSGALNTVRWSHALHRVVMAVPGPVHSAASVGPHRLVRDAEAVLVTDADEVMAAVGPLQPDPATAGQPRLFDAVPAELMAVREQLPARGGVSVESLVSRTGLAVPELLQRLAQLELRQLVRRREDDGWSLARP